MIRGPNFHGIRLPEYAVLPPEVAKALPYMGLAELKVALAVIYQTWQVGGGEQITIPEIERLTGLSRQAAMKGVQEAMKRGVLSRFKIPNRTGQPLYGYAVAVAPPSVSNNPSNTKTRGSGG